jgi:hypothetical protein
MGNSSGFFVCGCLVWVQRTFWLLDVGCLVWFGLGSVDSSFGCLMLVVRFGFSGHFGCLMLVVWFGLVWFGLVWFGFVSADSRQQTAVLFFGFVLFQQQQTADSRQQTADSRQQTADNRQQTTDSRQQNFGHQDEAEGRLEERVQQERLVGGEEKTGGRMPCETHKAVRDAQREVRPGGLEEGSEKEIDPKRQTEGSRRGRTSAQAM